MKKGTSKAVRYIFAGCVAALCVIMAGCGCGKKKTDPSAEQVLKISITPEPTPTLAPDTVNASAVTTSGDVSMVNLYVAENPSAASVAADDTSASTDGSSDEQSTDDSEDQSSSDSSEDQSYDDGSYDEDTGSEE